MEGTRCRRLTEKGKMEANEGKRKNVGLVVVVVEGRWWWWWWSAFGLLGVASESDKGDADEEDEEEREGSSVVNNAVVRAVCHVPSPCGTTHADANVVAVEDTDDSHDRDAPRDPFSSSSSIFFCFFFVGGDGGGGSWCLSFSWWSHDATRSALRESPNRHGPSSSSQMRREPPSPSPLRVSRAFHTSSENAWVTGQLLSHGIAPSTAGSAGPAFTCVGNTVVGRAGVSVVDQRQYGELRHSGNTPLERRKESNAGGTGSGFHGLLFSGSCASVVVASPRRPHRDSNTVIRTITNGSSVVIPLPPTVRGGGGGGGGEEEEDEDDDEHARVFWSFSLSSSSTILSAFHWRSGMVIRRWISSSSSSSLVGSLLPHGRPIVVFPSLSLLPAFASACRAGGTSSCTPR